MAMVEVALPSATLGYDSKTTQLLQEHHVSVVPVKGSVTIASMLPVKLAHALRTLLWRMIILLVDKKRRC